MHQKSFFSIRQFLFLFMSDTLKSCLHRADVALLADSEVIDLSEFPHEVEVALFAEDGVVDLSDFPILVYILP